MTSCHCRTCARPAATVQPAACLVSPCPHPASARGLCKTHYHRARREGWLDQQPIHKRNSHPQTYCSIDGCPRPMQSRGYCQLHYRRWLRAREVAAPGAAS